MAEISTPAIASATDLVVRYGTQTILDRATLTIHEGERVGLVGRNGTGKSTFLRIATGVLEPDSGLFTRRRDLATGYLPQIFDLQEDQTVEENIRAGAQNVLDWIAEYENESGESARSSELLERINHADGWNLDYRTKSLVTNLHAPDPERIVRSLSGGEKRRVALCRALLARPDFLVLDEPTNHLDTGSIEWLEDFLSRYGGTCLFVTHDRYFLDRITTRIVELSQGRFHSYDGNYTDYLLARAQRQSVEELQEKKRQKFLKRELEWVRKGPRARRTKSVDRIERYFEMAAQQAPEAELDVDLIIPPAPKLSNRVVQLRQIGMDMGERTLFDCVDLDLAEGERLGIVGSNGLGKSTLLKVILGQIPPTRGEVELGARTQINYIDQNRMLLDDSKTIWEEVGGSSEQVYLGDESISLRSYLRRFLFSEDRINTKIELLSGGERSRVLLAKILKRGGNVLILDEPTNDLDLGTLRLLEEALVAFKGSVIVVSHDRYFLNRVCTSTLAFEGEGVIRYHVGNYDYYLEKRATLPPAATGAQPAKSAAEKGSAEKPRKLKWKEERELQTIEADILSAEQKVEGLSSTPPHGQPAEEWSTYDASLQAAQAEVARLYARWETLEVIRKNAAAS